MTYALAAIFAIAVLSKLRGMPASMLRAMAGLRLPAILMDPALAWAHLVAQVATIILLIAVPQVGLWCAGVLLACYLALVVRARGGNCQCFGEKPMHIGPALIARNAFFLCAVVATGMDSPMVAAGLLGLGCLAHLVARSSSSE